MTTLVDDRDRRGLYRLLVELPVHDVRLLARAAAGRWPASLAACEVAGHLVGPVAWRRARVRARRLRRSGDR